MICFGIHVPGEKHVPCWYKFVSKWKVMVFIVDLVLSIKISPNLVESGKYNNNYAIVCFKIFFKSKEFMAICLTLKQPMFLRELCSSHQH